MPYPKVRSGLALAAGFALLLGCESESPGGDGMCGDDAATELVCGATPGAAGASPGFLAVFARTPDARALEQRLESVVVAAPGPGGRGGLGVLGSDTPDGPPGADDDVLVVAPLENRTFDESRVDPDHRIDIAGAEGDNAIALGELIDPPAVAVQELRVRPGAVFALSCDTRIVAQRVVIEAGATLVLQTRNHDGCVWSFGEHLPDPGQRGAVAAIETQTLVLDGTIDLAGAAGHPGAPGGSGGRLTILADEIELGDAAVIDISGGAGGDGIDEAPC